MKKLLKSSFLLLPFAFSFIFTSCANNQEEIKQIPKLKENPIVKANEKFANSEIIKNMYSILISQDKSIQETYIKSQDNINIKHTEQVNYALRWFVPMFGYLDSQTYVLSSQKDYYENSKNIILDTLNENWYWYLKNIDNFKFSYNPYEEIASNFKDPEYLKSKSSEIFKKFPSLSLELSSNEIKYDWKFEWKNTQNSKNNNCYDLEAHYLIYDLNHVVRYWIYKDNNKKQHIKLIPDLYYVENINNYDELKQYLSTIESRLFKLREEQLQLTAQLNEGYLIFYNNENLVDPFASNSFNYLISTLITNLNKENQGHLYRFTWRSINV